MRPPLGQDRTRQNPHPAQRPDRRKKRCWWLAPTKQMSSPSLARLEKQYQNLERRKNQRVTERRIDLPGGGMIAVRSAFAPDFARRRPRPRRLVTKPPSCSRKVWTEMVRPMLVTTLGSAVFLSTPRGANWFSDLFALGRDPRVSPRIWQAFRFPTAANPLIQPRGIGKYPPHHMDHVWQTVYQGAVRVNNSGQVFRHFRDAVCAPPAKPQPDHRYVAGIDWGRDVTTSPQIAVIDATANQHGRPRSLQSSRLVPGSAIACAHSSTSGSPTSSGPSQQIIGEPIYEALISGWLAHPRLPHHRQLETAPH